MEVRHFSARSPRCGGYPSLESNSLISVKDSATGTFQNKDVTSKLTILSSGSREISEISWTKCELRGGFPGIRRFDLQFRGIRRLSTSVEKSLDLRRVVISRSMREAQSRGRIE